MISEEEKNVPETEETQNTAESEETTEQTQETEATEEKVELTPEDQIVALQMQLGEQKDKFIRLYSEFENYRRRTAKERTELIQTAGKGILEVILPVLDDFQRAEKSFPTAAEGEELDPMVVALRDSVKLVHQKLRRTLEQKGLKPMESAVGQPFDPDLHEAITQIPAPSEDMKGKVVDEIERGYYLGDKILRFTKVVVGA
ncbi:MAG: nucleotide exchange factor GrpE [Bacteroidota bacterium]